MGYYCCLIGLCAVVGSFAESINGFKVQFQPSRLSVKTRSTVEVSISISWPNHVDWDHEALLLKTGNGNNITSRRVKFDDDGSVLVYMVFPEAGRFTYYVELVDRYPNDIQGSLVVHVYHHKWADVLCYILGWAYFFIWSLSFYPQVLMNHRRKSVVGLSFDFTVINLVGFAPFVVFNALLLYRGKVQDFYFQLHPHSPAPVELNDLVFAIHATILCTITAIQCFIFEKGDQKITLFGNGFIACSVGSVVLAGVLVGCRVISVLQFVYVFSYIKLASTLVKCIPQIYFNYKRKNTVGWSIGAILMDMLGGAFSFLQQFVIALNYSSWSVIYNNVVKLLLGIGSIVVDVVFIFQHYVLYADRAGENV